jgi:hypothetical protein
MHVSKFSQTSSLKALLLIVLLSIGATAARAQVFGSAIGPKVGLYLDGGNPMIGAIAEIPIRSDIDIEPGLELVLGKLNVTRFVIDANIRYSFLWSGLTVKPFVMAGLGLQLDQFSGTETASRVQPLLNVGGGLVFNTRSRLQPWFGLKFSFLGTSGDGGALLQGGVNFYVL